MRKRLLCRAADCGYTEAFDIGCRKVFEEGFCCEADTMLDSPDTIEFLKFLKDKPWISIGWHRHLWESPVLPASDVPSLVDAEGRFKWRHNNNHLRKEATYDDAYREFCAELDRCYEYCGRYPEVASVKKDGTELENAFADVCMKYSIDTKFWSTVRQIPPQYYVEEGKTVEQKRDAYSLDKIADWRPDIKWMNITWKSEDDIPWVGGHPGYLDDHIWEESSCTVQRIIDVMVYFNEHVVQWLIDNKVELVNISDIKYGTTQMQDHLKEINSPLWIGNYK